MDLMIANSLTNKRLLKTYTWNESRLYNDIIEFN